MAWADAAIAAGAAVAASALTGVFTTWGTRRTLDRGSVNLVEQLKSQTANLMTQLGHERTAAREDRDQERRKDAYVPLLKYVYWLQSVSLANWTVINRAIDSVLALRRESYDATSVLPPRTTEWAAAENAAFEAAAEANPEEQEEVGAGPTREEGAALRALVEAVATDAVRDAFHRVNRTSRDWDFSRYRVKGALLPEPKSSPKDSHAVPAANAANETITDADEAAAKEMRDAHDTAIGWLDEAVDFASATAELRTAYFKFADAVTNIEELVRTELNNPPDSKNAA
jgi:hypothetical protein